MAQHSNLLRTAAFVAALLLTTPALAEQPQDAWITTKAKTALLTDDVVNGLGINVDTFDGHVTLHGKVATDAEKAKAEQLVKAVEGVTAVHNLLVVVPGPARAETRVADDAIQKAVHKALEEDEALAQSDIEVKSVNAGVVVLSGEAKTLSAHRRAIATARRVDGVQRVASEIHSPNQLADQEIWHEEELAGESSDAAADTWITTKAKLSLMKAPGLSPLRVNVDTENGVVTLFGNVDTAADKARAGTEVAKIKGVARVENQLQVVPDVAAERVEESDETITAAVRQRLEARASLSDADLDVATENGVVRLTGEVASQSDRLTALTLARGTAGVRSIIDDIELRRNGG